METSPRSTTPLPTLALPPASAQRSRLATGEVPEIQRFEYWLDMICCNRPCVRHGWPA